MAVIMPGIDSTIPFANIFNEGNGNILLCEM